jgi:membrane carboxypeptidase/penicillin-binding protein PbpC
MQIRTASAFDYLVPLLSTLRQIGPSNAWRIAQQSGLNSLEIPQNQDSYGPILDQGFLNLMELTHAYSMFANQGKLAGAALSAQDAVTPISILEVVDGTGRKWPVQQAETKIITTPQLAFLVTDMLGDEEARRESLGHPNPFEIARPVAGKPGRALTESSTWTIGFTPDRVIGVWMGLTPDGGLVDETSLSPNVSSGIWHALMKTAHQSLEYQSWNEPLGIVHQVVCVPSGMLPTEECPKTSNEIFIAGNEPRQSDNLYRTFMINTQTGRLATIYTPTEFLQEKVYLVVPPEAQEWAVAEGLEIPPDSYDVVFNPGSPSQTASILLPEIFSYVSGQVEINGNASGENFSFYRLQIGEGLNPRQWLQIGEEISTPVEDDLLATWDTSGLNGLYAVRLQVVAVDQNVETISIQVTVDNQPPAVQVIHPSEGQTFSYPDESELTFQVQVTDNLGLTRLEFWLDGSLLSTLSDPPYAAPWSGTVGSHELEIRAVDQAGNISVVLVPFDIER